MKPQPLDGVTLFDGQGRRYAFICQPHRLREETLPFHVRQSGEIGQEIIGPDGNVYAWATNPAKVAHICWLLTAYKNVQDRKASSGS